MSMQMPEQAQNLFPLIRKTVDRQDEQGKAIQLMVDQMQTMYDDFSGKYEEMKELVQEVRDSVTLTYAEMYELQCLVYARAKVFVEKYDDGIEKLTERHGRYRRSIWKVLKSNFKVNRYPLIRRVDFEAAKEFVANFSLEDFMV